MKNLIRIASRQSQLALWQSNFIADLIKKKYPQIHVEVIGFKTQGDIILDQPLAEIGGKGLFIKELEQALLEDKADIAVHSMKDVPMNLADPFEICAITKRENPSDAFISNHYDDLQSLPPGSIIGTSSLRRQSLIHHLYPGLLIQTLRGNLQTRLSKLDDGQYDAIILASAGLIRLGLESRIKTNMSPYDFIPAVGQGALGIEVLKKNNSMIDLVDFLDNLDSRKCVEAERIISKSLAGSCTVPMGAHAIIDDNQFTMNAFVGTPDGEKMIVSRGSGEVKNSQKVADDICHDLIQQGAKEILGI
jgi:hydroxymethylbilane synthase